MSILNADHFHNEEAAYRFVEARLWPNGPVCPRCKGTERVGKMGGKSTRIGTYKCYECRKPFTVKIGTIFEASHIKMHIWLQAIFLIASSKKGISANQLHRTLGVTLKTAWFLSHRIREAMKPGKPPIFGSGSGIVEADETYIGKNEQKAAQQEMVYKRKPRGGWGHKNAVFALVERGGQVQSFHISGKMFDGVRQALKDVPRSVILQTDEAKMYRLIGKEFARHGTVNHSKKEYVSGIDYTNTVENFFSVFKRGMRGTYQHCSSAHLQRYLAEFDFRHNNRVALGVDDSERAERILKGVAGKRLTYQTVA